MKSGNNNLIDTPKRIHLYYIPLIALPSLEAYGTTVNILKVVANYETTHPSLHSLHYSCVSQIKANLLCNCWHSAVHQTSPPIWVIGDLMVQH